MLLISWTATKLNETVLREDDIKISLISRIHNCRATFLWPYDEKRETRTSCDKWSDGGENSQKRRPSK